jgi:molecular chaperone DnaK (HSP70)
MNSAMLNYDDFDLETATEDRFTLREAIKKASEIRSAEPNTFVRIRSVGADEFILIKLSTKEVYAEWTERLRQRLARFSRRRVSR